MRRASVIHNHKQIKIGIACRRTGGVRAKENDLLRIGKLNDPIDHLFYESSFDHYACIIAI